MNTQNKFELERDARLKYQFLRFKTGIYNIIHKKWTWFAVVAYIFIAIVIKYWLDTWTYEASDIGMKINNIGFRMMFPFLSIGGFIVLIVFLGTPKGAKKINQSLNIVGLVNHAGQSPLLLKSYKEYGITIMEFDPNGIPLSAWEDKKEDIETALNMHVENIRYGKSRDKIVLQAISGNENLPEVIHWKDKFLSDEDFTLIFGQSRTGQTKINLAKIPHILLGGSTGSGKSVLLKSLIMQCVKKDAEVFIADFKGGVDFLPVWHERCNIITEENTLLEVLTELVNELENRKQIFREYGCANISEYNKMNAPQIKRIVFACDEVAEVLDKTGLSKEAKELVTQIEGKLSIIARQGRAFGIHLILATQRPDANILAGQIRNNIDFRVCGRADNVLSQIILDNTNAAEQIPKDSQGLFITHDGVIFKGYLFDEKAVFDR
ncbi:MAG: DNA translocase FtsK [Clostridia bacterium]|nr:DNA translocase FtsK [Clostridia bacterium]